MYIVESIKKVDKYFGIVGITIGNFEGFHRGHQKILRTLKDGCKKRGLKSAVLTFKTHPLKIIRGFEPERLWSHNDKIKTFIGEGIDFLICIDFTLSFADTTAEDFIEGLAHKVNPKFICLGEEFRFGRGNAGSVGLVEKYSNIFEYDFIEVQDELFGGDAISSTRIRQAIKSGDIKSASKMLGRNYSFYLKFVGMEYFEPFLSNQALPHRGEFTGMLLLPNTGVKAKARVLFPEKRIEIIKNKAERFNPIDIGAPGRTLFSFEFSS